MEFRIDVYEVQGGQFEYTYWSDQVPAKGDTIAKVTDGGEKIEEFRLVDSVMWVPDRNYGESGRRECKRAIVFLVPEVFRV